MSDKSIHHDSSEAVRDVESESPKLKRNDYGFRLFASCGPFFIEQR